ncbi:phage tail tape measure protein [Clostridium taeniosporum]|uniref:Phage tail tape measure protein n=1 Tax=Clostridium taeniosporum TaxID=394958 RepID=A0A1D7XHA0_9CLOT|nr:phage tail tape measure protein [Clostridium taeniosporum]AOR22734.1 phage tail tape measure protein [Clostridium taeniosporum]
MAEELGSLAVKIGLDSSGFQNGISSINRNLRVLDSEFKANTAALGENAKGLEGLKLKSESLTKQLELQKQKVSALQEAYTKSAQTKGNDSEATQALEIKLNKAKQTLSQMETELSKANKEIETQSSKWTSLGKSLDGIGSKMKSVGEGFSNAGSKLSIGLTAPLATLGVASVKLASDMNESMNKVEVAFGGVNQKVKDWSDTTLKSYGIAKGTALDMSALYGDMATSMGLNQEEAAKMSMSLVGLAGDLSSFKNIGIEEAETALNGIFTGETESLKMLGVVMTDTNLQQYAYSKGIEKKTKDMTESEKVQLRYNFILEKTKNAQGDFERTGAGTANQMRVFQESLKELGATMGQNILPVITPIITKLNEWVQAFGKLDPSIQKIIIVFAALLAALGPVLSVIGSVITVGSSLVTLFGSISTAVAGAGGAMALLTGPVGIAIAAITAIIAVGVLLYNNWDTIKAKASELWSSIALTFENIKTSISNAWENVKTATLTAWENLKSTISNGLENIKNFLEPALNFYETVFQNVWDAIKNIVLGAVLIILDIVTGNFTQLKSDIENIWNNIKTALTNIWEAIKNTAINAWTKLKESVTNLCNNIKETVLNIWNGILTWFSELPGKLYNYGSSMFTSMKEGISSTIGNVKSAIESGINSALTFLASLPSKAWNYGADFVEGIVKGIKSAMGKVEDAVSGLAAKIRSYLHFSVPDEGPLTDYESWMPDFMSGLAEGINKSKNVVSEAINKLSLDMNISTKLEPITVPAYDKTSLNKNSNGGKGLTLHIENFINNTEKDIEQLAYELEFYRQKISMGKGGV